MGVDSKVRFRAAKSTLGCGVMTHAQAWSAKNEELAFLEVGWSGRRGFRGFAPLDYALAPKSIHQLGPRFGRQEIRRRDPAIRSISFTSHFDGNDKTATSLLLIRFATPKKPSQRPIALR